MKVKNYFTIDEYLADLPKDERQALQRLREIIHRIVPGCTERIAYKICVISYQKDLVGFAAQKNFLSFYAMSPKLVNNMELDLKGLNVSGATIHFTPQEPLSTKLIEKILNNRLKEIS